LKYFDTAIFWWTIAAFAAIGVFGLVLGMMKEWRLIVRLLRMLLSLPSTKLWLALMFGLAGIERWSSSTSTSVVCLWFAASNFAATFSLDANHLKATRQVKPTPPPPVPLVPPAVTVVCRANHESRGRILPL
jgi:hypothetical protein